MKDYEDRKYEQWRDTTEQLLPTLMKKSLLMKVRCHAGGGHRSPDSHLGWEARGSREESGGTAVSVRKHWDGLRSASVSPFVSMSWVQWRKALLSHRGHSWPLPTFNLQGDVPLVIRPRSSSSGLAHSQSH